MSKRLNLLYFLVVCFWNTFFAQDLIPLDEKNYIQALQENIQNSSADSIQLHNLLLISAYWAPKDSIQSKQALNHVLLHPNKEVLSKAMLNYYQGYYYTHQSQKEKAKAYYKKVIEDVGLVKNTQSKMLLARAWYQYAYIQVEEKGYDYMVEQLTTQCIPLAIESKNKELQAYFKTQLGLTFMSVGQFDTAEEHHLKALAVLQSYPLKLPLT